ncbi:MAG: flagellin [Pseudomonadota bacterium]
MTSILTNNGAMVALQTLTMINDKLTDVQGQIATGKKVNSSADNASIWAVTTVMEADIDGFNAISESLSLGKATVSVARNAAEKVTDLLREVKEKVVLAQGENVDRNKIQTDIDELSSQVESIVNSAQFNGLNLIDGSAASVNVLSSLDRSSSGISAANITVNAQDLSRTAGTFGGAAATTANYVEFGENGSTNTTGNITNADTTLAFNLGAANATGDSFTIEIGAGYSFTLTGVSATAVDTWGAEFATAITTDLAANDLTDKYEVTYDATNDDLVITNKQDFVEAEVTLTGSAGTPVNGGLTQTQTLQESAAALTFEAEGTQAIAAGTSYRVALAGSVNQNYEYIAAEGDTINDVTVALAAIINGDNSFSTENLVAQAKLADDPTINNAQLLLDVDSGTIGTTLTVTTGGVAGGALATLSSMDVTTSTNAATALQDIERLIQTAVDASAAFGSSENRIDIQSSFVTSLVDSMKSGVGALVDTNMEKASAELQALQVQQQLGTQALSIANSGPQNILSLFR